MQKNVLPISICNGVHQVARSLLALAFFLLCTAFATSTSRTASTYKNDGWVFDKSVNNVEFYYKLTNCDGKRVVLLKLNNKNDNKVKVTWKEVFETQMEKATEGFNGQKQLFIAPGETMATGCNDDRIKELMILPQQVAPTYVVTIRGFSFKDVEVTNAL